MWGGKLGKFIFFSRRLGFDLVEYGEGLRRKLKRRFGRDFPLVKILWDKAEEKGLFPPDEEFPDWFTNFWAKVPRTQGRRLGKLSYTIRRMWRRSSASRAAYWLCYMPTRQ